MSGKVLGPSDRPTPTSSSRSNSPTASASPKASSAASKLSSEGVSPKQSSEKAKAEAKPKGEKGGTSKQKGGKAGKNKKEGKEQEDVHASIPADTPFAKIGSLKDVAGDQEATLDLLIQKLSLCETAYNFQKDDNMPEKEGKRFTLLEILANWPVSEASKDPKEDSGSSKKTKKDTRSSPVLAISDMDGSSGRDAFLQSSSGADSSYSSTRLSNLNLVSAAVKVVKANAFRTLIHKERTPMDLLDGEDDEPLLEPTWPHLELVYDLSHKILGMKELEYSVAQEAGLDKRFVAELIELIETDDPREREDLKSLILKIFSKFNGLRSTVRKTIQSYCQRAVSLEHGEAPAYGLSELLEVLGQRVVAGFANPLRKEQKELLTQVLLPLYKLDFLSCFHSQLKDVVRLFCKKDPSLIKPVAQALLRYWPQCASSKQTIFLGELEDMIHMMPSADFKSIAVSSANRISMCCVSPHSEVAEKALGIWRHQPTARSTVQNCREDLPLIVSRLYSNITQAWGPNVMSRTMDVLKNFMEADRELFDNCSSKHRKQADDAGKKESIRLKRWAQLQELHDRAHPERDREKNKREAKTQRESRTRNSSGRPKLPCNQEVSLKQDSSCAFSLCWDWAGESTLRKDQLQLQALLVNADGKIVDAIHARNITCFQSAVRLTARAPQKNSKEACCGTIWATLDLLPVDIAMILCIVTSSTRCYLGDVAHEMALVVDFNGKVQLGEILAEPPGDAKMGLLGCLKRLDWSSWNFIPKVEWATTEHFMDMPEMIQKVIKEALPTTTKKQRGLPSFVAMSKGSVADCPVFLSKESKATAAPKVFLGMGWDFYSDEALNMEVALVFFNANAQHISTVSKGGESVPGAFHTGDGTLSAGIFVDFQALPLEVSVGFLTAHVEDDFMAIQQPHCTAIDSTGKELLRYAMPEEKKSSTGLIMARIFWNEFYDRWSFQALGNYCSGRSWSDSMDYMKSLVTVPPSSFQTLLIEDEDMVTRGDHRSTTAASSSAQSVIMSL